MVEWLKKHWEILAAIAVGIPVLYWLYTTYQSDAVTASTDTTLQDAENAAQTSYAQEIALGNVDSGYGGGSSGGGSTQGNTISTSTTPVAPLPLPVNSGGSIAGFVPNPPSDQNPDYSFSQDPSVANNPNPIYASGSTQAIALGYSPISSAVTTLLGSGGGGNDSAPVGVQGTTGLTQINDNIYNGTIPEHGTAIPKTPTPVELASLGGRGTR